MVALTLALANLHILKNPAVPKTQSAVKTGNINIFPWSDLKARLSILAVR